MKWNIPARSDAFREAALARQAILTKPAGALGALEDVAVWLADVQQSSTPQAGPASAIVFASDHPVSHLGVSAYPPFFDLPVFPPPLSRLFLAELSPLPALPPLVEAASSLAAS